MIKQIAFTVYPVKDVARARKFYEDLLGLPAPREMAGGKWVEYTLGESCFAITSMAQDRFTPRADGPGIAFEVDDVDATYKHLKDNGVRFTMEPMSSPICRMAMALDTERNLVTIHKRNG